MHPCQAYIREGGVMLTLKAQLPNLCRKEGYLKLPEIDMISVVAHYLKLCLPRSQKLKCKTLKQRSSSLRKTSS